jgi:hypothetical protein
MMRKEKSGISNAVIIIGGVLAICFPFFAAMKVISASFPADSFDFFVNKGY